MILDIYDCLILDLDDRKTKTEKQKALAFGLQRWSHESVRGFEIKSSEQLIHAIDDCSDLEFTLMDPDINLYINKKLLSENREQIINSQLFN